MIVHVFPRYREKAIADSLRANIGAKQRLDVDATLNNVNDQVLDSYCRKNIFQAPAFDDHFLLFPANPAAIFWRSSEIGKPYTALARNIDAGWAPLS